MESEIKALGMVNEVNLCDHCTYIYPECPCDGHIIFGSGKGEDNICSCSNYVCSNPIDHKMKIEQIAFATDDPQKLMDSLTDALGLTEWHHDEVCATGKVFGRPGSNKAELHFNYELGFELEILQYLEGPNWHECRNLEGTPTFMSHMGRHVTGEQMEEIKIQMAKRGIEIAQEVYTDSHTNPVIAGKRKYHYVVFDSLDVFGFDLKLIERFIL